MIDTAALINRCYDQLPHNLKEKPWEATEHGRALLQTQDQLNAYIAAYGEMHMIKCKAALQNFPFDDLKLYTFEIFDWGCGQGIATLTLLDMLYQRDMLQGLKKITLIEPSAEALHRATDWVTNFVGDQVEVFAVNKFIPNNNKGVLDEVFCSSRFSINLFSNILDIRQLSLGWLAKKTSALAPINYMICVGPSFTQGTNTRIMDFCGYFPDRIFFSEIDSYPYAYTSRTNHPYGCQTRCFTHHQEDVVDLNYLERADNYGLIDPYENVSSCFEGIFPPEMQNFYGKLLSKCSNSYKIFTRVHIGSDQVDFLLLSQSKGVIIINTCQNINDIRFEFSRIENIKQSLLINHIGSIKADSIANHSLYNCIKTGLYFVETDESSIEQAIDESNIQLYEEYKKSHPNAEYRDNYQYLLRFHADSDVLKMLGSINATGFKNDYYQEILSLVSSRWHSYVDGDTTLKLLDYQKQYAYSNDSRLRVQGVAGSGKTQVVANRAVHQHLKTGKKVLILTFNISLIQYIRMRIGLVPADFSFTMFEITNYHQFFISKVNQYIDLDELGYFPDNSEEDCFEEYANQIERYQTIIIDEVQDFRSEWISILVRYFLTPDGSISLFGDRDQNIYDRTREKDTGMPHAESFRGPWHKLVKKSSDKEKHISMRTINPQIVEVSALFARMFLPDYHHELSIQSGLSFSEYKVAYWMTSYDKSPLDLAKNIQWILDKYNQKPSDVTVLGRSTILLRSVSANYCQFTGNSYMSTFETEELFEEVSNQYSESPQILAKAIKEIRRSKKVHFTTMSEKIKFATIQSFKGWESPTVILFIEPEKDVEHLLDDENIRSNYPALLYTAMTRARCNLFIINLGNKKYDDFFKGVLGK